MVVRGPVVGGGPAADVAQGLGPRVARGIVLRLVVEADVHLLSPRGEIGGLLGQPGVVSPGGDVRPTERLFLRPQPGVEGAVRNGTAITKPPRRFPEDVVVHPLIVAVDAHPATHLVLQIHEGLPGVLSASGLRERAPQALGREDFGRL